MLHIKESYNHPIILNQNQSNNNIIINQDKPLLPNVKWTLYPREIKCPNCNEYVKTNELKYFNGLSSSIHSIFFIFIFTAIAFFAIIVGPFNTN